MKIRKVYNTGAIDSERVLLDITEDCDAGDYMLVDTTYDDNGNPSNKFRHVFVFPKKLVKKGDIVVVRSKAGDNQTRTASNKTTPQHDFYWGLKGTVWNTTGDMALLLKAPRSNRQLHKVVPYEE